MTEIYQWLNKEKSRYYVIDVQKDADDGIALKHSWGGCHSNRGGKKSLLVQSDEEIEKYIGQMMKRRKSRGYELVSPAQM